MVRRCSGVMTLVWLLCAAPTARGQLFPATQPLRGTSTVLAGSGSSLWIADVGMQASRVAHRNERGEFLALSEFNGRIARIAALERGALLFFDNGDVVEMTESGGIEPRRDMPRHRPPLDVLAVGNRVFALVSAAQARNLPPASDLKEAAFEVGSAAVCLVVLDVRGWSGVAACPEAVTAGDGALMRPRLLAVTGNIALFWADGASGIAWSLLKPAEGDWQPAQKIAVEGLTAFAPVGVGRVPALILSHGKVVAGELQALRLLGGVLGNPRAQWSPSPLTLAPLPIDAQAARLTEAAGLRDYVALALTRADAADSDDALRVVGFAGFDAAPADQAFTIDAAFQPPLDERVRFAASVITAIMMAVIVTLLFVFRRGAPLRDPKLPTGMAPALQFQRLLGGMIDVLPFSFAMAAILRISWQDAMRELMPWAVPWVSTAQATPGAAVIGWWAGTAVLYTTYALLMEALTTRTVGKVLTGTRVRNEDGQPPALWQRLLRNVVRLAELIPPFWAPLFILFLLSRGRQRLGDLFAKTIVVRQVAAEPPAGGGAPPEEAEKMTAEAEEEPVESKPGP